MTLSGATTLGQIGPRIDSNERVLCISQSSSTTEASTSYSAHSLGEFYSCAEMQSVYSAAPVDWTWGQESLYIS